MIYGLDVGGTKIELAVFDAAFDQVSTRRIATPKRNYQEFLDAVVTLVRETDQRLHGKGSVGIGLPGVIDRHRCAVSANVPCINGKPLADDLSRLLERPVAFENDVKAFTLSEVNGGGAAGKSRALGVVIGTGVAGALSIDGKLYRGRQGVAGEFGHIPLPAVLQQRYGLRLRPCGCGLTGCVEMYLAGPGLLWLSEHFNARYHTIVELLQGVRDNHDRAQEILSAYLDCLGCHFAQLTLLYDPDVIVLGGGLSNIPELYQRLPTAIGRYLFTGVAPPPVLPPRFGDSSGVRGAAILGHQEKEKQEARA